MAAKHSIVLLLLEIFWSLNLYKHIDITKKYMYTNDGRKATIRDVVCLSCVVSVQHCLNTCLNTWNLIPQRKHRSYFAEYRSSFFLSRHRIITSSILSERNE